MASNTCQIGKIGFREIGNYSLGFTPGAIPAIVMPPAFGTNNPLIILINVVFPLPFGRGDRLSCPFSLRLKLSRQVIKIF